MQQMETVQIRMTKAQLAALEERVKLGFYNSRSEAVRDAVRQMCQPDSRVPTKKRPKTKPQPSKRK